jgi:Uma2 family endonuclease
MSTTAELRWTSADLEFLDNGNKHYEIIDGELFMSKQPHYYHQKTCGNIYYLLTVWSLQTGKGEANFAPGLIFADDDDVAPDVTWISYERRETALEDDGKLHAAPELVVEVVSPGWQHAKRDRETKLKLYSRRGVSEYWVIDWVNRQVEVFRRENAALHLVATLFQPDTLTSPLLPDFSCQVSEIFRGI